MTDRVRDVVIAAMNRLTGVLNEPEVARKIMAGGDMSFAGLDMDSLTMFEMIMEIEEKLGIELNIDALAMAKSLSDVVNFVKAADRDAD